MRKTRKPVAAAMCALVLALGVNATYAYLTDSESVTNTFTVGNVGISLTETWNADSDNDGKNDHWEAKLIPGVDLSKNPTVTVEPSSEACWLFVEVVEGNWPAFTEDGSADRKVDYALAEGWKPLLEPVADDEAGTRTLVYYLAAPDTLDNAAGEGDKYNVLAGEQVTVSENLTKAEMNAITEQPTLTFTAYAVQYAGFEPEGADAAAEKAAAAAAWAVATQE